MSVTSRHAEIALGLSPPRPLQKRPSRRNNGQGKGFAQEQPESHPGPRSVPFIRTIKDSFFTKAPFQGERQARTGLRHQDRRADGAGAGPFPSARAGDANTGTDGHSNSLEN